MKIELQDSFDEKWVSIPETSCWWWVGVANKAGYGRIKRGGKQLYAHRVSHELHIGPIPEGMMVLHRCDNPCCVNPDHLFLGTHQDNMDDRAAKGRTSHTSRNQGEACHAAKLNEQYVRIVRNSTASAAVTAGFFGVSETTIRNIRSGKTWGHVQ